MMTTNKWTRFLFASILILLFLTLFGIAQTPQNAERSAQTITLRDIQLSFKRDPRLVDPFRGVGEWVVGSVYTGALAQDTVEARANGVDATGRSVRVGLRWNASDPEMVTISP